MRRPNLFTIAPAAAFLDTLVESLLDGTLVGLLDRDDPFSLADATLYLPTRRAGRVIRDSFLRRTGRAILLPRIRILGDIDEDESLFDETPWRADAVPPAIAPLERQLVLSRLVLAWSGALLRAQAGLPEEDLAVPASPADAAYLAAQLGRIMDHHGSDIGEWRGALENLDADLARYWEITREFLSIVTEAWPVHLDERGLLDPGARRDRLIREEAARLAARGAAAPVIAAGSTGSVAATAELLKAIAGLPNGAVILPGLDQALDGPGWAAIEAPDKDAASAGHPQFGLKSLLAVLEAERADVVELAPRALGHRARFVSEAMRPAATTDRWSAAPVQSPSEKAEALADVAIVEAPNEREEALAVALVLREAVETPQKVAALVTPDRGLARRVAVELRRWAIDVDDSAGEPLIKTPPAILARLVAEVGFRGARAEPLLALLKHPLARLGLEAAEARRAARALERGALRGPRLAGGLAAIRHALQAAEARSRAADPDDRPTNAAHRLLAEDFARALDLADRLSAALGGLEALAASGTEQPLKALVEAHAAALAEILAGEGAEPVQRDEATELLLRSFQALADAAESGPPLRPADYPDYFAAILERGLVRPRAGADPRIHILGTLEARLQRFDVVVLGSLNEGTWPGRTRLDPLLSRPMRAALSLEPPERRIGLAAHDFTQALGHPKVWLTRAGRQDGEPRVAARWLQRLMAYAGDDLAKAARRRGDEILRLARGLDEAGAPCPASRPAPAPPLAERPKRLSATRIETLIRDPYAIYAERILRLSPFEPIARMPDARDRGTILHTILHRFVADHPDGPFDEDAKDRLLALGRDVFAHYADFPEIAALWWPRFERVAAWFVAEEATRGDVARRHVEISGTMPVGADFSLTARADRIDLLADGSLAILDYKTGAPPSDKEVLSIAPQLPLEALIAEAGGFEGIGGAPVSRLEYYQLSGRGEGGKAHRRGERAARGDRPAVTLPEALATTRGRLADLVAFYADAVNGYLSQKVPRTGRAFPGDYDHLARVAEWSLDAGDGGGEGE